MTLVMGTEIISKRKLTETNCFQDSTGSQSKEGQQKLNRSKQKLAKGLGFLKKIFGAAVIHSTVIPQHVSSNYYIIYIVLGTGITEK